MWCKHCGDELRMEWRYAVTPPGTYSLAGVQPKVAAIRVPVAICDRCGKESVGQPAD